MNMLSNNKRISLWLLPPEAVIKSALIVQQDIISHHSPDTNLPSFTPHITLIGGVPITECCSVEELASCCGDGDMDEEAAKVVLKRLQDSFRGFGAIQCNFVKEKGVFAARLPGKEGSAKWNQSCVAIVERTESFMKAMKLADKALFPKTNEPLPVDRHFRLPLYEPHFSFIYGNDPHLLPSTLECPVPFTSNEMIVMWTYPSTLKGVHDWNEIGRVNFS